MLYCPELPLEPKEDPMRAAYAREEALKEKIRMLEEEYEKVSNFVDDLSFMPDELKNVIDVTYETKLSNLERMAY